MCNLQIFWETYQTSNTHTHTHCHIYSKQTTNPSKRNNEIHIQKSQTQSLTSNETCITTTTLQHIPTATKYAQKLPHQHNFQYAYNAATLTTCTHPTPHNIHTNNSTSFPTSSTCHH
ncbi:hypothetical protein HYC85_013981 [Camellia sinensis]|uniref:Uncharacterized protein n=1 Tax=Camellia sinensis TaxID=4442 RepID=A0A7J7H847_CAMSI|nr:hypothetical protein HYC85_013981 [Camellia sinensis]